ncbi:6037_t:CDS:1, partial [Ambispora gerdemannii]
VLSVNDHPKISSKKHSFKQSLNFLHQEYIVACFVSNQVNLYYR